MGTLGCVLAASSGAGAVPISERVEGQPLGENAKRLLEALEFLGHPLPEKSAREVLEAARRSEAAAIQKALDPFVLLAVQINPELRVRVSRGAAPADLHQHGFTPVLVKVLNQGAVTQRLAVSSPQAGPVYAGASLNILRRQQQTELLDNANIHGDGGRFLEIEMYAAPPMTGHLSGLEVEYAIALISASEAGKREATIGFDVGQGTQDLGFRGQAPVLFDIKPAIPVELSIRDHDGFPTVARLLFRDSGGRVYPSQAKRLAPDFFFQPQIYRGDGEVMLLPPGTFELTYCRGPEYRVRRRSITVPREGRARVELRLERWIEPAQFGFYSGDHHIHGAGCSHYEIPTQGVRPEEMFRQVKGEGLNVGCVLTWGPCFEHQRQFFAPEADALSEPLTLLKYDLEISGFGSAALGHVCLINLQSQTYPGTEGTTRGWPTWTVPVLRWAKEQGGITGYPHSDMQVDALAYARRYVARHDRNGDGALDRREAEAGLMPLPFARLDLDGDGRVTVEELAAAADHAANELPNLVLPSMRGSGAMEIFVSVVEGVCDFISAMDTGRVGEWNTWYHLMNSGFPLKVSGETDFPCMSSLRVGQGRVYVKMAESPIPALDFSEWCAALAQGRSYVSDGYAHALEFTVNGAAPGPEPVPLAQPGAVQVRAKVAFAPEVPKAVAHGTIEAPRGRRELGDTRLLHAPRSEETVRGGERLIEIIRNGQVVARRTVPADGAIHEWSLELPVERSSWIALRHFPQLHTNPVAVIVEGKPIRASRQSALWCAESVELLWENRSRFIAESERPEARAAYDRALEEFRRRAEEAPE